MKVDVLSLVSGAVTTALGAALLLDSSETINVSFGWSLVVLTGAVGVILLLSGLVDRGPGRHD
jgi:hypothetical protein